MRIVLISKMFRACVDTWGGEAAASLETLFSLCSKKNRFALQMIKREFKSNYQMVARENGCSSGPNSVPTTHRNGTSVPEKLAKDYLFELAESLAEEGQAEFLDSLGPFPVLTTTLGGIGHCAVAEMGTDSRPKPVIFGNIRGGGNGNDRHCSASDITGRQCDVHWTTVESSGCRR
ncbi:hypothetical protein B0H16DRAFT_1473901 [Mycena metata]|uniref:Uncharacterized protein n=1 Tax=Mycena metata TaxID=1033252 RepID=A0AAD7HJG6_9AGAR|nr:hypothetical protein B0H16DRAFT_1473901 [Mycena metata]